MENDDGDEAVKVITEIGTYEKELEREFTATNLTSQQQILEADQEEGAKSEQPRSETDQKESGDRKYKHSTRVRNSKKGEQVPCPAKDAEKCRGLDVLSYEKISP